MSGPRRREAAGFTLLEVMCAFAILAIVSAFMVVLWTQSLDKAGTAIDRREMRDRIAAILSILTGEKAS